MENPQDQNTFAGGGSNKIQEPGRGTLILVFGIISIVLLGPILGIPAWVMGHKDLKKINAGIISHAEKGSTKTGMILGIIGTFFSMFFIIIIGIAVVVGINLFTANTIEANRDAVVSDCMNIEAMARQYYAKPAVMGGGNNSFTGFEINSTGLKETANGSYSVENINDNTITIIGVGKVTGMDGSNPVKVIIRVNGDNSSVRPDIIN